MGQQQLLLIILGVIIVGIAIAVGLQLFQSGSIGANQDAMVNDMMNIAAHAEQFRIRPESMGGGGGSLENYVLPERLATTGNGTYTVSSTGVGADATIEITGNSVPYAGDAGVELTYDPSQDTDALRYDWTFTGLFDDAAGA